MLLGDPSAPRGSALNLNNTSPDALVIPASQLPAQQSGTIEFDVHLAYPSSDPATHTLFADTSGRFKLIWAGNALTFSTTDADGTQPTVTSVTISNLGWTNDTTWHHVGVIWNEAVSIQL